MKRILSILLTLLLLLGSFVFALPATAEESVYAVGDIIEYGTYKYNF